MRALVTLKPTESKKLIGRAVAGLPDIQAALEEGVVIIGTGSTNAEVVAACTELEVDRSRFIAGMITRGMTCVTPRDERKPNLVLVRGEAKELMPAEALELPLQHKVLIKGANALDPEGVAGVLMAAADGGTVGRLLGHFQANGWPVVMPVGLEKLIPSVPEAAKHMGRAAFERSLGARTGLMPVVTRFVITEVGALQSLFHVEAVHVASGGIAGSEGAVTLALEGAAPDIDDALEFIQILKATEVPPPALMVCTECSHLCDYAGTARDELPEQLRD